MNRTVIVNVQLLIYDNPTNILVHVRSGDSHKNLFTFNNLEI